jgi:hypothetical protein
MINLKHFVFILFILFYFPAYAYDSNSIDSLKKINFKFSTGYLSNYLFNGRADSLKAPYFVNSIEMKSSNGFLINASTYYLLQKNNKKIDFIEINGSYEHDLTDRFTISFDATKYFNSSQRISTNSDITATLGASATYDLKFLFISAETDILFSSKSDVYLNIEFDKEINIIKNNFNFSFNPKLDFNFSSLGYYEGTVTKNSNRITKKNKIITTQSIISTSVDNPGFKFMDFEFALPINIVYKKFGLIFTTTFVNPMNPVSTKSVIDISGIIKTINSTPYSERILNPLIFTNISFFINL